MKCLALFMTAVVVTGCCPCRHLTTSVRDSVRIETVIRTERVADTILVDVPVEVFRQTMRDTTSHLETSLAASDARINADGSLFHYLENKAQKWVVATEKEIVYRDSVVYRDRETENIIEVARPLTWWQQTQIRACWVLLALLLVICHKPIVALAKRLIG